jgi:hypothetical protein
MLSPSQPYLLYYQSTKPPVSGSSAAGLVGTWSVLVLGLVVMVRARVRARARARVRARVRVGWSAPAVARETTRRRLDRRSRSSPPGQTDR